MEEYTSPEVKYKFLRIGQIKFEDNTCLIADGKSDIQGNQIDNILKSGSLVNINRQEAYLVENLRIKEIWTCFIKLKENDEFNQEILDIILINNKLFKSLPETDVFTKLDNLYYRWLSSVVVKNFNLSIFETKYFNNPESIRDPQFKKYFGQSAWYEYNHKKMMDDDNDIVAVLHGMVSFARNKQYDIYGIKDSKNDEILAINIEIDVLEDEDDEIDWNITPKYVPIYDYSKTNTNVNMNVNMNVNVNKINSSNVKTL